MTATYRLLLALALLLVLPQSVFALDQGERLIPFAAKDMKGNTVDLSAVIGKQPVMLVFWASWCPNCRSEVPKVNTLKEKYEKQGMTFLAVNVGHNDSKARARKFMEKYGMKYPVIFDERSEISTKYRIRGVPTVLVANRKGIVVFKNFGVPEITEENFRLIRQ